MIKVLVLFISLMANCYANDNAQEIINELFPDARLSNAELNLIGQELRVQSLVIESILELQESGVEFQNTAQLRSSISEIVKNAYSAKSIELGERITQNVQDLVKSTISPEKLGGQFEKVYQFVLKDLITKKTNITSLTRRFGTNVGMFYLVMMQIDYTIPLALIATGNLHIGIPLLMSPISSTSTALFATIKSSVKHYHMIRKLGFKNFIGHWELSRKIKKFLGRNMLKTGYVIDLNIRSSSYLMTVNDPGALRRMINPLTEALGFTPELNYKNLKTFLQEERLLLNRLLQIDSSQIADLAKMLLLIKEIEVENNPDVIVKLQSKFGKKVNLIKSQFPSLTPEQLHWFIKAGNAKNIEDVFDLLRQAPNDIPAKAFGNVWREYVLGSLSKSLESHSSLATHKAFRKLHIDYDSELRPLFIDSLDTQFSGEIRENFNNYIFNSLAPIGSCGQIYTQPSRALGAEFLL
jgi:hypothetical protein